MKSSLIQSLFFILLSVAPLHADFFAYQRWIHKDTGQRIHEFYDMHMTKGSARKQQQEFINAIQQCGPQTLAIIEDSESRAQQALKAINTSMEQILSKPDIQTIKNAIKQITQLFTSREKKIEEEFQKLSEEKPQQESSEIGTPISGLYDLCKQAKINAANVECRNTNSYAELFLNVDIENEIMHYNDNEVLNNYYKSLHPLSLGIAQKLIPFAKKRLLMKMPDLDTTDFTQAVKRLVAHTEKSIKIGPMVFTATIDATELEPWLKLFEAACTIALSNFIKGAHLVDARTLHLIHINPQITDFFIAEGAAHIQNINTILPSLGFIPEKPVVNPELIKVCKKPENQALQKTLQNITSSSGTIENNWMLWMLDILKSFNSHAQDDLYMFPIDIADVFRCSAPIIKSRL